MPRSVPQQQQPRDRREVDLALDALVVMLARVAAKRFLREAEGAGAKREQRA